MFCHDFGVHRARVFWFLLLLMLVLAARAIEVNRHYLCGDADCERYCADKNGNLFLHVARVLL